MRVKGIIRSTPKKNVYKFEPDEKHFFELSRRIKEFMVLSQVLVSPICKGEQIYIRPSPKRSINRDIVVGNLKNCVGKWCEIDVSLQPYKTVHNKGMNVIVDNVVLDYRCLT